jgi:hypothetical protein
MRLRAVAAIGEYVECFGEALQAGALDVGMALVNGAPPGQALKGGGGEAGRSGGWPGGWPVEVGRWSSVFPSQPLKRFESVRLCAAT